MDSVLHLVEAVMASPWLYVLLFAIVAADSVFPVFPGETVVITAGAYAVAQESPHALVLIPVTMAAARSSLVTDPAPRPLFAGFALLAATAWALYNVGIGMAGGLLFRERPLLGVVLGIALALVLSWLIERIRSGRETRSRVLQSTTS